MLAALASPFLDIFMGRGSSPLHPLPLRSLVLAVSGCAPNPSSMASAHEKREPEGSLVHSSKSPRGWMGSCLSSCSTCPSRSHRALQACNSLLISLPLLPTASSHDTRSASSLNDIIFCWLPLPCFAYSLRLPCFSLRCCALFFSCSISY